MNGYTVRTIAERPDTIDENWRIIDESWDEFLLHDSIGDRFFGRLYEDFTDFQFMLYDGETVVATCSSIPVIWDLRDDTLSGDGWDWALEHGFHLRESGGTPTTLCALSITVARDYLGKGVSRQAVLAMKTLAIRHGFNALIAPVAPTFKRRYPLIPMERYITWTQDDGAPFDPWLRTHWRVGAKIVKVALRSMVISGTAAEWEAWTGMQFPESGSYVVPGAMNPVDADLEHDHITYVEPNVWMHHPIER